MQRMHLVALLLVGLSGLASFRTLCAAAVEGGSDTRSIAPPPEFVEITPKLEDAVEKALAWLAKSQSKDGSWGAEGTPQGEYQMAMTSLAGLALVSAGHQPERGKYGRNISRAIEFVLKHVSNDGFITSGNDGRPMYGHGFAMTFLAEVYGSAANSDVDARIKAALIKAVRKTQQAQSNQGGWYYSPNSGADEGSVTITQVQALRAARNAGIDVPEKTMKSAIQYLHNCQNADGGIRYSVAGGQQSTVALTAAGAEVFLMAGEYKAKDAERAVEYLKKNLNPRETMGYHDFYTNFYGAQAMFQIGGDYWVRYFTAMRERLLSSQTSDGSWRGDVGATYSTSIGVMICCLPYRYLSIFQK
jgi:squalene cyclase